LLSQQQPEIVDKEKKGESLTVTNERCSDSVLRTKKNRAATSAMETGRRPQDGVKLRMEVTFFLFFFFPFFFFECGTVTPVRMLGS